MTDRKKMGKANRRKGGSIERKLVNEHKDAGIPALRVPLSGAAQGYKGDIRIAESLIAEVKSRKGGSGFKTIEGWLEGNDLLFLHRDRRKPLVVMEWPLYLEMVMSWLEAYEEGFCRLEQNLEELKRVAEEMLVDNQEGNDDTIAD